MGGGGGGYERRGGDGSSNGEDESDEDEQNFVPTPDEEPEDDPDGETSEESDSPPPEPEEPPDGDSPSRGGAGAGPVVVDPGGGENGSSDKGDGEEADEQEPSKDDPQHDEEDSDQEDDDEEDDDEEDDCLIAEETVLHSPNPGPLEDAEIGEIHTVELRDGAVCVVDPGDRIIGSVAEPWVDTLKQCLDKGYPYRARILNIDGGACEVRVVNKCLIRQATPLTSINRGIHSNLYEGRVLGVEASDQGAIVVTVEGTQVGDVPDPWATLLSECIDRGATYVAEVNDVSSDACKVTIRNGNIDE